MKAKSVVTFAGFVAFLGAVLLARSESGLAEVTLVRGVVENISGDTLTVKSPSGLVNVHIERPLQIYRDAPSDRAHVNARSDASTLTIQYGGGVQTISIPPDVPVTASPSVRNRSNRDRMLSYSQSSSKTDRFPQTGSSPEGMLPQSKIGNYCRIE